MREAAINAETEGYGMPLVFALALHCLLLLVLIGFPQAEPQTIVPTPRAIKASLVVLDKPISKPSKVQPKKKPAAVKQKIPKSDVSQAPPAATKNQTKKEAAVKPKPAAKPKPALADPGIDPSLDDWLAEEDAELEAAEQAADEVDRDYYAALIEQQVYRSWSRPASARNGMEVILAVRMLPRGDIVSVSIKETSGNAAFDRAAIAAVKRLDRIRGIGDMESRLFEKYFRAFDMLFRPEDLRL